MAQAIINKAHWLGDVEITDVAGMTKAFSRQVDTVFLEFKAVPGVEYYVLVLNPDDFQGTGTDLAGSKKVLAGNSFTLGNYGIKKFTAVAYDVADVAVAIGEIGYMAFMTDGSLASYIAVTP